MKRARTSADLCPACVTLVLPSRAHWMCDRCWRLVPHELRHGIDEAARWHAFARGTAREPIARRAVLCWFWAARDLVREVLAAGGRDGEAA